MKFKHILLVLLVLSTLLALFSCVPKNYTVTFDANGGTIEEDSLTIKGGEMIGVLPKPTKDGYTFIGWYDADDESFEEKISPKDLVVADTVLVAKWEINQYTVKFDANGGNGSTEKTVDYSSKISAPMVTKPNYSLVGWFYGDTQWSFHTDTVTSNIRLTAKWEGLVKSITFNANGGTVSEAERKVHYGDAIGKLPIPVYESLEFLGWYDINDTAMETPITEDYIVTEATTLVAKWKRDEITVYFDSNGETDYVLTVTGGDKIGRLPLPSRSGYVFVGWYLEDDTSFSNKITEDYIVSSEISLVAFWQRDESAMKVEFDANGGVLDESEVIKYVKKGKAIGPLPTPTREGHTFVGWLLIDGTELTPTTIINTNTICLAVWTENVLCTDGTENHTWSAFLQATPATCELPEIIFRTCYICGCAEYRDGTPALGHDWSDWSEEYMKRSRSCYECKKTEVESFKDVTIWALGAGNYPKVEGDVWNGNGVSSLINGMYEPDNSSLIAGKGNSSVAVTLELANPTAVDMIYVKGRGSATIEVTVTYEDGTTKLIGIGSFGDEAACFFTDGNSIVKVTVNMPNPSEGNDFWQEITLAQKI